MIEGVEPLWDALEATPPDLPIALGIGLVEGVYRVPFLDRVCEVAQGTRTVTLARRDGGSDRDGSEAHDSAGPLALAVLSYLCHIDSVGLDDEWVSEKALPGGSIFFQGPHALPLAPLVEHFGENASAFAASGQAVGGVPSEYGDASVMLETFPKVPVCFVLWEGDDEFPANATAMFDRSIARIFALDVILAVVESAVRLIVNEAPGT